MWETLRNAWKMQDLRKKILYTVGMLLVYSLLCYVPTPGVDPTFIQEFFEQQTGDAFNFFEAFTGGSFSNFFFFSFCISTEITSFIIFPLLPNAFS